MKDQSQTLLNSMSLALSCISRNGTYEYVNARFVSMFGYTLEDVATGKKWFEKAYPDPKYRQKAITCWLNDFRKLESNEVRQRIFTVTCKDGATKDVEFKAVTLTNGWQLVTYENVTERKQMIKRLKESENFRANALSHAPYPIIIINPDTSIRYVNPALVELTGFSSDELIGRKAPFPFWTEETMEKTSHDLHTALRKGAQLREELFQKKNGEQFWIQIIPVPVIRNQKLSYFLGNWVDITERKQMEEQLIRSREQMCNLSAHLQSAREEERTRIAREIHDELGQVLTALKMDVYWLSKRIPKDQESLREKTQSMSGLIDVTLQSVKRISAELRPGLLDDLGLTDAVEWQAQEFQKTTGIECIVNLDLEGTTLDHDRSTTIFRIFQEALTNAFRHSNATKVVSILRKRDDKVELKVSDNGRGITQEQICDPKAFGLIGMRERACYWGGQVKLKGVQGKGTAVKVTIPLSQRGEK